MCVLKESWFKFKGFPLQEVKWWWVNFFKRDYKKAKAAALQALTYNNSLFDMVTYTNQGGPTVLAMPAGSNPETLSYMYISSYNELNYGYSYRISGELKTLFGSHDARYNLFFDSTNKTYLDIGAHTAYWKTKYTAFFYPTVGIQVPEVYLMLAGCYARTGDLSSAMDIYGNGVCQNNYTYVFPGKHSRRIVYKFLISRTCYCK